jgi:acyl-CoA reductase-like NAD-dependent aldehyde dehydrogenase
VVRKVSAALAAGCSMLVKAPEETPACDRNDFFLFELTRKS